MLVRYGSYIVHTHKEMQTHEHTQSERERERERRQEQQTNREREKETGSCVILKNRTVVFFPCFLVNWWSKIRVTKFYQSPSGYV